MNIISEPWGEERSNPTDRIKARQTTTTTTTNLFASPPFQHSTAEVDSSYIVMKKRNRILFGWLL
jgi:hypothetical protein